MNRTLLLLTVSLILPLCAGAERLQLGAVLPLTGPSGALGVDAQRGIKLATADDAELSIVFEDAGSSTAGAISAYKRLVSAGKIGSIITLSGPMAMSLAPLAGKDQIQLFAIASEPASSPSDPLTYRIIGPSEQEATQIVETISKQMQATTVAVLYVDTDYGRGLFQSFKQALTSATRLVYQDSFPASTEDLRPQLLRLKSKQPAAIFLIGWGRDTGLALKQAYELGIESQFICPQACQEKELIDVAGEAAEGLWVIASKEYAVAEISSAAMVLNEQTDNRNQFLQKKVINGEFVVQQKLG